MTALVVVYFLVSAGFGGIRAHQLRQQEGRLDTDIQQLQERYQRLDALRQYLKSDEYIEGVARQQLGLVREGETGIVVVSTVLSPTPTSGAGPDAGPQLWWDVLIR